MDGLTLIFEIFKAGYRLMPQIWWLVGAVLVIRIGLALFRQYRLAQAGIADIDRMDGADFEQSMELVFRRLGYGVDRTPFQGDYGADLIVRREGEATAVQLKRYTQRVGVKAVQEVVAARQYYNCGRALVVTNSTFSAQAQKLAKANQVELWDRTRLVDILIAAKPQAAVAPAPTAVSAPPVPAVTPDDEVILFPACAQCGRPVSAKVLDYCKAHPEYFGGMIYCYQHQQEVRRAHSTTA